VELIRINTLYQLYADKLAGADPGATWMNLPEYVLSRWGGSGCRVHERDAYAAGGALREAVV